MLRRDPGRIPAVRTDVITLLDALRAAERAGAQAVGRWIATCEDPRLRGGLRVIQARDDGHATLAEERLRALGGAPAAEPTRELVALCDLVADPAISDRSKLAMLMARAPTPGRAPLGALVRRAEVDAETRALLVAIDDDERASLAWLRQIAEQLGREDH
jgi:hypothetical protein